MPPKKIVQVAAEGGRWSIKIGNDVGGAYDLGSGWETAAPPEAEIGVPPAQSTAAYENASQNW